MDRDVRLLLYVIVLGIGMCIGIYWRRSVEPTHKDLAVLLLDAAVAEVSQ